MTKSSAPLQSSSAKSGVPIPSLPSTYSVHDFHNSYGSYHGSGSVSPALHFHLAATINARTDIPLVPAMTTAPDGVDRSGGAGGAIKQQHNFVLHWLNNKEMQFTMDAEKIMDDLFKLAMERDSLDLELELQASSSSKLDARHHDTAADHSDGPPSRPPPPRRPPPPGQAAFDPTMGSTTSLAQSDASQPGSGGHHGSISSAGGANAHRPNLSDMLDSRIDRILKDWHQNSDLLFSVHPVDGSLLVWVADFMDEYLPGSFRQAQVSFSCRIPNALPLGDAMTMGANVELFNPLNVLNMKEMLKATEPKTPEKTDEDDPDADTGLKMKSKKSDEDDEDEGDDENVDEKGEDAAAGVASPVKKKRKSSEV